MTVGKFDVEMQRTHDWLQRSFEFSQQGLSQRFRDLFEEAQRDPWLSGQGDFRKRFTMATESLGEYRIHLSPRQNRPGIITGILTGDKESPVNPDSMTATTAEEREKLFSKGFAGVAIGREMVLCFPDNNGGEEARHEGDEVVGIPLANIDIDSIELS